jgi:hypothetical protein
MERVTLWRLAITSLTTWVCLAACTAPEAKASPTPFECHPTIAHMTPPTEAVEFFAGGSSSPNAREILKTSNWYGNDAMWVILPPNGEIIGRLDEKIPPYRIKQGYVIWSARQLDGNDKVASQQMISGYGDLGFQAGGPGFPHTGCWEVTYALASRDELRFVLRVR